MIKTTNPFDHFLSSYEEDHASIDYDEDIRSILFYIGLVTVILFLILLMFSLINKCMKMFKDETIPITKRKKQQIRYKRYQSNFSASRQTSITSISSSAYLINYQPKNKSSKPSLSATLRMLQYKEQHLPSIVHV